MAQKSRFPNKNKTTTRTEIRWKIAGVAFLSLICLVLVLPAYINKGVSWVNSKTNIGLPLFPQKDFNLGLDLQGGAHLIYQAKTDTIADGDKANSVEGVRDVIERRVRGGLGVAEPLVQTTRVGNDYRIIVELPGVTDVNQAIKMIGETPVLEFKEENTTPARDLTAEEKKQLDDFNNAAQKKIKEALALVKKGTPFEEVVAKYSDDAKTKNNGGDIGFVTQSDQDLYSWAVGHKDGDVSQTPVKNAEGYNVVKMLGSKDGEKQISAAHILICYEGAAQCSSKLTKEQALAKINDLKNQATAANFADLAKKNSTEPGADKSGGELPLFTKGQMVPEFEKAVWDAKAGTIIGPVETQFGYHLIYKKDEVVPKEYHLARVLAPIKTKYDIVPPQEQWSSTGLSGKQLKRAEVTQDSRTGEVQVSLQFDDEGSKLFGEITTRNVGKPLAIFLDNQLVSNPPPRVNEPITSGSAVISGRFTYSEARIMAQRLNSGALPVPVELLSQQKVDATLGVDSLHKSFTAGVAGLLLVMIFMALYYRLPGLLSVFSLAIYTVLNLALFKILGVTLTLAGIAGFILSIGMAVDANVLVFERLKEELRAGKGLRSAMEESFVRAWPSIRDGHVTTLISCFFLMWFGSGFIQGFATVLATGTLISLFTAVTITRTIMRLVFPWFKEEGNILFLGHTKAVSETSTK